MTEIQLTRIKSIYGDVRGLLSQIPSVEQCYYVNKFTVDSFNSVLDDLSRITNTDYSHYKIPDSARSRRSLGRFDAKIVRVQIGRVISRLEEEYEFGRSSGEQSSPSIVILNKNKNEISLQIDYTINDLIEKTNDDEGKIQLRELRDELERPSKNWEKIKVILIWTLNFSKDLFLKILPIILQKKL